MTSLEIEAALVTVLLPAVSTALGLAAAAIAARWHIAARVISALALAAGVAVADVGIRGWQGAWPIDITRRLPHVALLAVVASAPALAAAKLSQWAVIAVALVGSTLLAGAIALGFANSPLTEDFSSLHRLLWWGVLGAILLIVQLALEGLAARRAGPGLPLLLAACAATSAGLMAAAGSLSLGQVCGGFAVCLCVLAAFALWRPAAMVHSGTAQVSAAVLGALVAAAHFFAELPLAAAGAMLAMTTAGWVGELGTLKRRPLLATFVQWLVIGVLAVMAIAAVWANRSSEAAAYG